MRAASAEELEARGTFLENMSLLCDLTAYTEDSVQGVKAAYAAYKAAKTTEAVEAATADLLKAMPNLVFVPNTFTDAQSGWYKAAVDFAQASGLMNGMTATEFAPNVTTTRAMVAQVLYRLPDRGENGRICGRCSGCVVLRCHALGQQHRHPEGL